MNLGKYTLNSQALRKLLPLAENERQREFIKTISKRCSKGDIVIYYIYVGQVIFGFVALSVNKIEKTIPTIEVEYILVKKEYRKKAYLELDNKRVSEFLLYFSYDLGLKLKKDIGLRWLSLIPDNSVLEKYYISKYDFTKFEKTEYLFLSLKES